MTGLFISLYLDEDVSAIVAKMLRARGFTAVTTLDVGGLRRSDAEQLKYAAANHMALLTHNRVDFERLATAYIASGTEHHGIIVAVRRPPREIVRRLLAILNHVTPDEMRNVLRYI